VTAADMPHRESNLQTPRVERPGTRPGVPQPARWTRDVRVRVSGCLSVRLAVVFWRVVRWVRTSGPPARRVCSRWAGIWWLLAMKTQWRMWASVASPAYGGGSGEC
jgi:hypothetical protein